jgi:hypothetical protein
LPTTTGINAMRLNAQPNNPFGMLIDPQAIDQAVEASGRLRTLKRKVCRPLDKPLVPRAVPADVAAFDAAIDGGCDTGLN